MFSNSELNKLPNGQAGVLLQSNRDKQHTKTLPY